MEFIKTFNFVSRMDSIELILRIESDTNIWILAGIIWGELILVFKVINNWYLSTAGTIWRKLCQSFNLHTERLVSLLQAAHGEVLQRVHVVTKVQPTLLSNSQGAGRDEGVAIYLSECRISGRGINQQLAVQWKNWEWRLERSRFRAIIGKLERNYKGNWLS